MSAVQYDKQLRSYLFLALCCSAILINIFGDYFTQFLLAEIIILSLFAMSLDFLAGRGGMISLGHAMFLGIGAYTTTILYIYLSIDPFLCSLITIIIGLILGYLIALIITKTHGIFFIMITLALGEMFHSWAFTNDSLGGSDGISGIARPDLLFMGLELNANWPIIQKRFKILVKKFHPDKNLGNKQFEDKLKKITLAYSHLKMLMI